MTSERKEVPLPSGMVVSMRGYSNVEHKEYIGALTERGLTEAINRVLTHCADEILVPGPQPPKDANGGLSWVDAFSGDRLTALKEIRALSYPNGHEYYAKMVDPKRPRGKGEFEYTVDLRNAPVGAIKIQPLPESTIEALRAGTPLSCIADGHRVEFRIPTGHDEEAAAEIQAEQKSDDPAEKARVAILTQRNLIVSVTDVETDQPVHANDIHRWLAKISADGAATLEDAMEDAGCGMDLSFVARSPWGNEVRGVVPFDDEFFRPSKERRKNAEARRAVAQSGV